MNFMSQVLLGSGGAGIVTAGCKCYLLYQWVQLLCDGII